MRDLHTQGASHSNTPRDNTGRSNTALQLLPFWPMPSDITSSNATCHGPRISRRNLLTSISRNSATGCRLALGFADTFAGNSAQPSNAVGLTSMKPSSLDLQFWSALNAPAWARTMLKHPPNISSALHSAIEFRGRATRLVDNYSREASNAVHVLRLVRKRGQRLSDYMRTAAIEYAQSQPPRAATYARWLRRMERKAKS